MTPLFASTISNPFVYYDTTTSTASATNGITITNASTIQTGMPTAYITRNTQYLHPGDDPLELCEDFRVPRNRNLDIELPDGSKIECRAGHVTINDANKKVIYKAASIRDFNRYLNCSELMEEFIRRVGQEGINKDEFLNLPVELFIRWLILRTAQADNEEFTVYEQEFKRTLIPVMAPPLVLPSRQLHRCKGTGRFISNKRAASGLMYANKEAMIRHAHRINWN